MRNDDYAGWHWRFYTLLLAFIGLALVGMGAQLFWLGGSAYYVLAGVVVIISALLVWRGDRRAGVAYGLMMAGTILWAVWEAGLAPWPLVARLVAPAVLGLPLLMAGVWRRGGGRAAALLSAGLIVVAISALYLPARFTPGGPGADFALRAGETDFATSNWTSFGRNDGGTRFAPYSKINQTNVRRLKVAWVHDAGSKIGQATPLKIGDSLYFCTADNQIIALDAETGARKWAYDPQLAAHAYGRSCRAVAYHGPTENVANSSANGPTGGVFPVSDDKDPTSCAARLFVATRDARLIAVDAATGVPCAAFGKDGTVDLLQDMGGDEEGYFYASSPPLVVGDIVIVGSCIFDGQAVGEPSGVVRAFDARSGEFLWAWDVGRPGIADRPGPGEHYTRGTPNVWTVMSVDADLGLVYLPTGNATPDYFGGHRDPAVDEFAASLVALDVKTGALRWHFKTVNHDIWDYDVASQPVLFDFPMPGGKVPAVLQATKRGELFVLDRRTGEPLLPVEERPAPQQGVVHDDYVAPTQPFSVGMPSLMDDDLTEARMWGLTPLDQLWCRIRFRQARYEGTMTPIGLDPMVRWPGSSGIYNWGSLAIDEDTGAMVAATLHLANYDQLIARNDPRARKFEARNQHGQPVIGPGDGAAQAGTPYAVSNPPFFSPLGVPCTPPPYGRVSAIDLNTRQIMWSLPVGTTRNSGPFGMALGLNLPMGVPVNGGMLVTRGGLSFFAGSQDGYLRAYATDSGRELWRHSLPAGTESSPMSYLAPQSGRQLVVVSVGGAVGTAQRESKLVAFALSE